MRTYYNLEHSVGTKYLFHVDEAELRPTNHSLYTVDLVLGLEAKEYPQTIFSFFERLWATNTNTVVDQVTHHQSLVLPPTPALPPVFLVSRYIGMSRQQVRDRRRWLADYKSKTGDPAEVLKHIPDVAGIQGVQQYSMIIPRADQSRLQYRLTGTNGIHVTKSYFLEAEAQMYGLPTRPNGNNLSPYPFMHDRHMILKAVKQELGPAGRELNFKLE